MILKDINITVVSGTSATITVQPFAAIDYNFYNLFIGQFLPPNVGTEPVTVTDGVTTAPLIDKAGNIVVLGKLRGGRLICTPCGKEVKAAKYRLQYGSNGMPSAMPHFVVHEGLCPMIYNGTAGALPPSTE
jgi:hypothetical protein